MMTNNVLLFLYNIKNSTKSKWHIYFETVVVECILILDTIVCQFRIIFFVLANLPRPEKSIIL